MKSFESLPPPAKRTIRRAANTLQKAFERFWENMDDPVTNALVMETKQNLMSLFNAHDLSHDDDTFDDLFNEMNRYSLIKKQQSGGTRGFSGIVVRRRGETAGQIQKYVNERR